MKETEEKYEHLVLNDYNKNILQRKEVFMKETAQIILRGENLEMLEYIRDSLKLKTNTQTISLALKFIKEAYKDPDVFFKIWNELEDVKIWTNPSL